MARMTAVSKEDEVTVLREASGMVARLVGLGAEEGFVKETLAKIKEPSDWSRQFAEVADRFQKLADVAKIEYARIFYYMQASCYYHIAEMYIALPNEEKQGLHASMVNAYAKARAYFAYPTEDVLIPYAGGKLKGYFRTLRGIKKAPCVILIRGADACREIELHALSNSLLDRGIFTLAIDLPGQGDQRFGGMHMTADYEKPVGAVVDYLATRSDVDADRIGVWGMSFGGFIAPKAAGLEKRIKACVSLSGFFSLEEFELPLTAKLNCMNNMKIADEQGWVVGRKEYTLKNVIQEFPCPLLVVTGSEDKVVPAAQAVKIFDNAPEPKALKVYEGAGHCVFYQKPEVLSFIADWMKEHLN
jgi:2,6-dihydroxypseudooxynicotine hydrolase